MRNGRLDRGEDTATVRCGRDGAGTLLYRVAGTAATLPPVTVGALARAWEAAHDAASLAGAGTTEPAARAIRFDADDDGKAATDLVLADRDARCWAEAVDRQLALSTRGGLSLCLRLLGLVDLIARVPWARGLCVLRREGAELDRALLAAAARLPLTTDGRLDETGMRGAALGR